MVTRIKKRIDNLIMEKGILESREKVKAYILGGNVKVDGETVRKPGALIFKDANIQILFPRGGYVSRGGLKLEGALKDFDIKVVGKTCLDIGASKGGFTDCLLKKGARFVYALDVGKNQIDYRLKGNLRVKVIERFNARNIDHFKPEYPLEIVTLDVSFISIKQILKPLISLVNENSDILALIKPQFELEKPFKGFRGVIRDFRLHIQILRKLNEFFLISGYEIVNYAFSRIRGPKGNIEYFVHLKRNGEKFTSFMEQLDRVIVDLVKNSHLYFEKGE